MTVGYTYVTRSATGWVYGGKREKPTFDDNYYGSGIVVKLHIEKYGNTDLLTCEPVAFYETYDELYEGERKLIAELREVYGDNCKNILEGGDGFTSEQVINLWSLNKHRERIINSQVEAQNREDVRKRKSESLKIAYSSKEARQMLSDLSRLMWAKEGHREMMIQKQIEAQNRPETREKKIKSQKDHWATPEARQRKSAATKANWENPQYRQNQIESAKATWATDEGFKKKSEATKNQWKNPEIRKRKIESLKAAWARRKAQQVA